MFAFGSAATLIEPKAVFADREGTIFVLDSSRADIREFSDRGELKAVLPFARPQEKQGEPASSVVVGAFTRDSEGRWYVIDRELARALRVLQGAPIPARNSRAAGKGRLRLAG